jgi:hypothetical protein
MSSTGPLALAVAAACWTAACGMFVPAGPVVHERHVVERGAATSTRVEIEMSAGELEMRSGAKALFEGDFDFDDPGLKPVIAYAVGASSGDLKVSQGAVSGNHENTWRLSMDEQTPIDLHVSLRAGDAELVLGGVNLSALEVDLGAGDLVVDLRGMPAKSYSVSVQAGAGGTTIRLPASVAVSARTAGLLGDVNVTGLEQRNGRWINPRAEGSPVTVHLQVQHAIGDLRILAE